MMKDNMHRFVGSGMVIKKSVSVKMQTADCRLRTRGKIQTESKTQAGCKMQNKDCRLF